MCVPMHSSSAAHSGYWEYYHNVSIYSINMCVVHIEVASVFMINGILCYTLHQPALGDSCIHTPGGGEVIPK